MMHLLLITAIAGIFGAASATPTDRRVERAPWPVAWAPADSAETLWHEARRAFADGDWERAVALFAGIRSRYPKSAYVGDAQYFEAYALYKLGETSGMRRALKLLDALGSQYAGASTVKNHEARTLSTRIKGALARGGDAASAEDIAVIATGVERAQRAGERVGERAGWLAEVVARAEEGRARASEVVGEARGGQRGAPSDCVSENDDERMEALNALLQMNGEQAMPILRKVMARRDKCSEVLRRKAVFLVSQKRTDDAAEVLLEAARTDPDREVREQAVFWLSQVSGDKAEQFLMGILKESRDGELQKKALFALSQRRSERAQQSLREYASREDAPKDLREEAIFWVGQRRSEENAQFLRQLFDRTTSEAAREKIIFSLAQMRGFGNEAFILEQVANTKLSMESRKQALFWAGQGSAVTTTQLAGIYDKWPERDMRDQVIFVIAQRGNRDPVALDKLIEIARTDKDKEMRKKAIFWLGQSKDPKAAKLLQELIEK